MSEEQTAKPKIIVDDDWKERVQAEKEAARMQKEAAQESKPADDGTPGDPDSPGPPQQAASAEATQPESAPHSAAEEDFELPPPSFSSLVQSLAAQALAALGQVPDAEGKRVAHLGLAKHLIDTMAMLEEKTRGNLTEDEGQMLGKLLYEIRMIYVSISKNPPAEK